MDCYVLFGGGFFFSEKGQKKNWAAFGGPLIFFPPEKVFFSAARWIFFSEKGFFSGGPMDIFFPEKGYFFPGRLRRPYDYFFFQKKAIFSRPPSAALWYTIIEFRAV